MADEEGEKPHDELRPVATGLWRCEVPGGWLYSRGPSNVPMTYVPFPIDSAGATANWR
jgi:hypothetical protein